MVSASRKSRDLARLRKSLALGPTKFILLRGVLGWGLPMFVLFTLLPAMRVIAVFPIIATRPAVFVPLGAVIWFGGGYLVGRWMWIMLLRRSR